MADFGNAIAELDGLLTLVGARAQLIGERVTRSTLYDPDYHVAMIACSFGVHASREGGSSLRILRAWLKLLQFVAARPRLAPSLLEWSSARRHQDFATWQKMPRGYVGDNTHDAVLGMLVATRVLEENGDYLSLGSMGQALDETFKHICEARLFETERSVIKSLLMVKVSKAMLGGL